MQVKPSCLETGSEDANPGSVDASISGLSLQEISGYKYLIPGLSLLPAPAAAFSKEVVKAGKENGHPAPSTVHSPLHQCIPPHTASCLPLLQGLAEAPSLSMPHPSSRMMLLCSPPSSSACQCPEKTMINKLALKKLFPAA